MAVRIRLRRMGAKKRPFYRLVVADARSARDGRVIDWLGEYDPVAEPVHINIDTEKAKAWLEKGAQPSDTAKRIMRLAGVYSDKPAEQNGTAAETRTETNDETDKAEPAAE